MWRDRQMGGVMNGVMVAILVVAAIFGMIALGWGLTFNQLGMQSFFNPKFEQVRRETFETSKAYRDGMAQELRGLQIEYIKADPKVQPALAAAIKHKAAGVPDDALPSDLALFVRTLP